MNKIFCYTPFFGHIFVSEYLVPPQRDCLTFLKDGYNISGIYRINPDNTLMTAPCDMQTDNGGTLFINGCCHENTSIYY